MIAVGMKVRKLKGYRFRGTVLALFTKSDGKEMAVVEVEPGENAEGLVYLHPIDVLEELKK